MSRRRGLGNEGRHAERYEIRVSGHLDDRWAAWFDGLSLRRETDGLTVIHGPVADQAALHGLLQRVRDIGLPLISVTRVDERPPDRDPDAGRPGDLDLSHPERNDNR
jgi:hypothetical protein